MEVIFECVDKASKQKLNSKTFSTKLKPGYCFGMTIDWASTSLKLNGVNSLSMMSAGKWPIIQSSYEINKHKYNAPDEVGMISANGLVVKNGNGDGEAVPFNKDFKVLAAQLSRKVGTHIFILFGIPGAGAHFMGFRRVGSDNFLLAEFFDPNDALLRFSTEKEFEDYLAGYLDFTYNGKHAQDPEFNEYCGLSRVALA